MSYILVLEDDQFLQTVLKEVLELEGLKTSLCVSFLEALETIKNLGDPLVILLDLSISDMKPEDFVDKYRQLCSKKVPLVLASGRQDIADQALILNAETYLKKPFDIEDISMTVTSLVQN